VTDRFATCAGTELLLDWTVDRHIFVTLEVDLAAAEARVHPRLDVVEVRPGVALLSVGTLRYTPGHFGRPDSPAFDEFMAAIHVAPDLSLDMPVPKMTFYATRVLSNSQDFIDSERRTIFTPSDYTPSLRVEYSADGLCNRVHDDRGPIMAIDTDASGLDYAHAEIWGQHFTDTEGLQLGVWEWDGPKVDVMRPNKSWQVHPHPALGGFPVAAIRGLYRVMVLRPGALARERFYAMKPLA
jgi:hypothetical protein